MGAWSECSESPLPLTECICTFVHDLGLQRRKMESSERMRSWTSEWCLNVHIFRYGSTYIYIHNNIILRTSALRSIRFSALWPHTYTNAKMRMHTKHLCCIDLQRNQYYSLLYYIYVAFIWKKEHRRKEVHFLSYQYKQHPPKMRLYVNIRLP